MSAGNLSRGQFFVWIDPRTFGCIQAPTAPLSCGPCPCIVTLALQIIPFVAAGGRTPSRAVDSGGDVDCVRLVTVYVHNFVAFFEDVDEALTAGAAALASLLSAATLLSLLRTRQCAAIGLALLAVASIEGVVRLSGGVDTVVPGPTQHVSAVAGASGAGLHGSVSCGEHGMTAACDGGGAAVVGGAGGAVTGATGARRLVAPRLVVVPSTAPGVYTVRLVTVGLTTTMRLSQTRAEKGGLCGGGGGRAASRDVHAFVASTTGRHSSVLSALPVSPRHPSPASIGFKAGRVVASGGRTATASAARALEARRRSRHNSGVSSSFRRSPRGRTTLLSQHPAVATAR